jgi:hypothetical protein
MPCRFQFSLKWLLAVPAVSGIGLAAFMAETEWIAALAIRSFLLVAFGLTATMVTAGDRYVRAFGIGSAFPIAAGAVWAVMPILSDPLMISGILDIPTEAQFLLAGGQIFDLKFRAGFLLATALLGGGVSVALRVVISNKESEAK